jgi:hypothetical protein
MLGKPFAGITRNERQPPEQRLSFPMAGMSNTPLALRLRFRGSLLMRSPKIRQSRSGKTLCEIYLRTDSSRVSLTGSGRARRERGEAGGLPYELAVNDLSFPHFNLGGLHSAYIRDEAFAALHRYAEAAAEFQKILDHRSLVKRWIP